MRRSGENLRSVPLLESHVRPIDATPLCKSGRSIKRAPAAVYSFGIDEPCKPPARVHRMCSARGEDRSASRRCTCFGDKGLLPCLACIRFPRSPHRRRQRPTILLAGKVKRLARRSDHSKVQPMPTHYHGSFRPAAENVDLEPAACSPDQARAIPARLAMTVDTSLNRPSAGAAVLYPSLIVDGLNEFVRWKYPHIPPQAS